MTDIEYSVLWSRDLTRKKPRWSDGRVHIHSNGISASATLFDEHDEHALSRTRLSSTAIAEDETTDAFEGFKVAWGEIITKPMSKTIPSTHGGDQLEARRQVETALPRPSSLPTHSHGRPCGRPRFSIPNQKQHGENVESESRFTVPRPVQKPATVLPPPPPPHRSTTDILRMIGMDYDSDLSSESQNQPDEDQPDDEDREERDRHQEWGSSISVCHEKVLEVEKHPAPLRSAKPFKPPSLAPRPFAATELIRPPPPPPSEHDSHTYFDLLLPIPTLDPSHKTQLHRKVSIPTRFHSISQYLQSLMDALKEEVELKLNEACVQFRVLLAHVHNRKQGAKPISTQSIANEIQASCINQHLPYFAQCELKVWRQQANGGDDLQQGRKRRAESDDACPDPPRPQSFTLVIDEVRKRVKGSRLGDLWLVSSHPHLAPCNGSWLGLVRSRWHGPNQEGKFEVDWVTPPPLSLPRSQVVYCMKGPDAEQEMRGLCILKEYTNKLKHVGGGLGPLVHHFISIPSICPPPLPYGPSSDSITHRLIEELRMNKDQAKVMHRVAAWVLDESSSENRAQAEAPRHEPLCLVHGPFGSGKSSLLVALILLIHQLNTAKKSQEKAFRVLISSHTNVAVDRILLGLKEQGFTSFMRIGSLKKINKLILTHSIHSGSGSSSSSSDTMTQLKDMLKEATNANNRLLIQSEIDLHAKGEERKRRKALMNLPVIGATLAALSDPLCPLFVQSEAPHAPFQLLILDECSQMTEPQSLAPILRSRCSYLIACGDPCQLPPVISSPSSLTILPQDNQHPGHLPSGLLRPMFVRLDQAGHATTLLCTQYRLHPALSRIPNKYFYHNQLVDGVSEVDRSSILGPRFPPLTSCASGGIAQRDKGSQVNLDEARIVAKIVYDMSLKIDLSPPSTIGVICFYVAQVDAIKREMAAIFGGLDKSEIQVATIDSFQGQEKEIIILATTIDIPNREFIADASRLNVALTRAKRHLVVVGCSEALRGSSDVLADLLNEATLLTNNHMKHERPDET